MEPEDPKPETPPEAQGVFFYAVTSFNIFMVLNIVGLLEREDGVRAIPVGLSVILLVLSFGMLFVHGRRKRRGK